MDKEEFAVSMRLDYNLPGDVGKFSIYVSKTENGTVREVLERLYKRVESAVSAGVDQSIYAMNGPEQAVIELEVNGDMYDRAYTYIDYPGFMQCFRAHFLDIVREVEEKLNTGRVRNGDCYWYVSETLDVHYDVESGRLVDFERNAAGNYKKSKKEAQDLRDKWVEAIHVQDIVENLPDILYFEEMLEERMRSSLLCSTPGGKLKKENRDVY